MKQFKSKRIKKRRKIIIFIFVFIFFFSYVLMAKYCLKHKLKNNILNTKYKYININISDVIITKIKDCINKPVTLLNNDIKGAKEIMEHKQKNINATKVNEMEIKKENVDEITLNTNEFLPIVYIYNTHQTEKYIDYSVYEVAEELSNKLTINGIQTYFEQQSISVFLQTNNLKYSKSYTVSRKYLNEAKNKYTSIKYFFDIHRDSVSKEKSTVNYDGKDYAKILFVIGNDNLNKEKNNQNTIKLNQIIKNKVPNISRGIIFNGGEGYNGIYNQDISENVFLIEIGGKDNSKEEVLNTMNILYESIIEYIRGII